MNNEKVVYVTYGVVSTHEYKTFVNDEASAKRSVTCHNKRRGRSEDIAYMERSEYEKNIVKDVVVRNFMSGKDVVIKSNTPRCCDPSSELYWSM